MTTTDTTAGSTTGRAATDDRQWWSLARLQVTDALRGLTITALVTLVVLAVLAVGMYSLLRLVERLAVDEGPSTRTRYFLRPHLPLRRSTR